MFAGEFTHNVDAKGRIIIPAKFREQLGEHFMVANWFDGCLALFTMEGWEEFAKKLTSIPTNQKSSRFLQRTLLAGASEEESDKQGKVVLNQGHRTYADISKEVKIIGVGAHIEIWASDNWNSYAQSDEAEMTLEEAVEAIDGFSF